MPTPSTNWEVVPVTGHYNGTDGTPISGSVSFTPQAVRFVDGQAHTIVIGRTVEVPIDPDTGNLVTALAATDDPDINGSGFTWQVQENFENGNTWNITVPLSAAGTGIDLATAIPVPPDIGTNAADYVAQVDAYAAQAQASATAAANSATAAAATNLPPKIDTFLTNGTWTKPVGAIRVMAIGISSGAGGGSGRRGAAASARTGGGGGAGGIKSEALFLASDLGATEAVTVAAGGAGGNAVATDSTDGNVGSAGGVTSFGLSTNRWLFATTPGGGGAGASGVAGAAGAAAANGGSVGIASVATGVAPSSANTGAGRGTSWTAGGGGAGGGLTTGDLEAAGGNGSVGASGSNAAPVGGTIPGGAGGAGNAARAGSRQPGSGGAGGAASKTTAAGKGGDGGFPGGGGGGGGASLNGFASGAGGKGGDGVLYVITYFS